MPVVHLMVGLPCSGKTSLARRLEQSLPAIRFTPDEWHLRLFGQDAEHPDHDRRHEEIEAIMWDIASKCLSQNISVILDYGFWWSAEREKYTAWAQALGASVEVHYLEVAEDELIRRVKHRNDSTPPGAFVIPLKMMRTWIDMFEPPTNI